VISVLAKPGRRKEPARLRDQLLCERLIISKHLVEIDAARQLAGELDCDLDFRKRRRRLRHREDPVPVRYGLRWRVAAESQRKHIRAIRTDLIVAAA
jgi:hypothetical protein